ncbi:hypothetical protein QBC44DRAFT_404416 [Cladorrhinum sp. PSN332]|nr:hypothetical protein QBC44DRAFT_404416 [Cladorrhinum sp. PSN332]
MTVFGFLSHAGAAAGKSNPAPAFDLLGLPNETILQIAESLEPDEAVALSLTCKRLYDLAVSYKSSTWTQDFQNLRGTLDTHNSPVLLPPTRIAAVKDWKQECKFSELRWQLLKFLEKDLLSTHQLCHYCRVLHRRLVPGSHPLTNGLQPITSCPWAEELGPNFFNLVRITFHHAHEAMEAYRNGVISGNPLPTRTSWRLESSFDSYVPSPTPVSCTPLPSLTFTSPWVPHPLSTSNPTAYSGIQVKVSIEAAAVPNVVPDSCWRNLTTDSLLLHSTQNVFIPSSMLYKPTGDDDLLHDNHKNNNNDSSFGYVETNRLGIQVCRHQPSYHPNTAWLRQSTKPYKIVEDYLNLKWSERKKKWIHPRQRGLPEDAPRITKAIVYGLKLSKGNHTYEWACDYCQTKWKITRHEHGDGKGIEGIVDVWQNLGNLYEDAAGKGCDKYEIGTRGRWAMTWYNAMGLDLEDMGYLLAKVKGADDLAKKARRGCTRFWDWDQRTQFLDGYTMVDPVWRDFVFQSRVYSPLWKKYFWWCKNGEGVSAFKELEAEGKVV